MRIHDVTMPLVNDMPVWPGDPAFDFRLIARQAGDGSGANVGTLATTIHVGTHVDSPFHVDSSAPTLEQLDLSIFLGPAVVLDVSGDEVIEAARLHEAAAKLGKTLQALVEIAPRLLLRTASWSDRTMFPATYATLSPEAAELIVNTGFRLLGVDVPSVDRRDASAMPIHHTLIGRHRRGAGVQILENLVLDAIKPGLYELAALPLKIVGGDGSPVRAVLIER